MSKYRAFRTSAGVIRLFKLDAIQATDDPLEHSYSVYDPTMEYQTMAAAQQDADYLNNVTDYLNRTNS